ncbi:hypothetical protein CLIM01_14151 [Colletotrichum limetticola]|uniref:Ankyrin repeat protein n=1 Tax=Colletotrichum limetticola TaxID=1209924 RepID=A0ABQ9PAC9_9PEZI|nr:hypothetical protein CLIM01_14151 [Colletotrichum limetticola]
MDAFEGRGEELRNVKKQNDNLAVTLCAMKTVLAGLQGQSPAVAAAVNQNIRSCEEDLSAIESLCIELSDRAGSTWMNHLENKKKKVTFAFHRPKLRDLELQLQKAHGALQLIQGSLGLETSNRNTTLLSAIESSSRDQAFELLLIRSEVAAITTPVANINDKLPGLQSVMTQTGQLVVAHSGAIEREIHESSQRVRYDIQHSQNSILEHLKTIDHKVQLLGEENSSLRALALKATSKPAILKSLCDDMQLSGKYCNQGNALTRSKRHRKILSSDSSLNFETAKQAGKVCICPRPARSFMQMQMQRGYTHLFGEWESQGHWPSCPLSKTPKKQRLKASLKYTGVSRLLKSLIEISLVLTSGAGGCSISPSFTYYPTADVKSDPAFRLIDLMTRSYLGRNKRNRERFFTACFRKLAKLFEERRTYPTVVDDRNRTLMHHAISPVIYLSFRCQSRPSEMKVIAELFPILLSYGVPAFSYDIEGLSPLHTLTYQRSGWAGDVVVALSRANVESRPVISKRSYPDITKRRMALDYSILSIDKFPEVATVFQCGPLSMAIVNSDLDEVNRVLSRFPDSIAELDVYGRSPLHLAAAKPDILKRLVKVVDSNILNQRDRTGSRALETAMALSSRHCVNGREHARCKRCSCYLCVKYLLDAGCDPVQMDGTRKLGTCPPDLDIILVTSSELARRHYVFHMRKARGLRRPGHALTSKSLFTKPRVGENRTTRDIQGSILQAPRQICDETDGAIGSTSDWIFKQIRFVYQADLFYRHGFTPGPDVFLQLRQPDAFRLRAFLNPGIVSWLLEHGGNLFLRSSAGPVNKTAGYGVFAAHYVFYLLGNNAQNWLRSCRDTGQFSVTFETLRTTVTCRSLTDGCLCPCSTRGCSPFLWMMKGFLAHSIMWVVPPEEKFSILAERMVAYYSLSGHNLTLLTYVEAIRFMTFAALDLVHSCCSARSLVEEGADWVDIDDAEIVENQGFLLDLHEDLVAEFIQEAGGYLGEEPKNGRSFPQFWRSYWTDRIAEELEKLDGEELNIAERREAEEIGVVWHGPTESDDCEDGNPYDCEFFEHYFFELDRICPEYNEPWPEGLRRIH